MVNFGTESAKDELIKEQADMLQRILDADFGWGGDVSENEVHQLVKKSRVFTGTSKTMEHIEDLIHGR